MEPARAREDTLESRDSEADPGEADMACRLMQGGERSDGGQLDRRIHVTFMTFSPSNWLSVAGQGVHVGTGDFGTKIA